MIPSFGVLDWTVVGAFVAATGFIGFLARKRVDTLDDFLVVGRNLRSVWGLATLTSTEMGLVTVIYFSEEAYANGFVAMAAAVIAAGTMWLIGRTGFVVKELRALELRTVPEYFEGRFSRGIRFLAGLLTFLTGVLNLGIFLQVEGRFLAIMFGLDEGALPVIMGVLLLIVVVYTMLGGMHSVVLTDVFQFLLMVIGVSIVTTFALGGAGGFAGLTAAVRSHYGSAGFNLAEASQYGLLFLIWTFLYYMAGWSSWQPVVQRTLSMRDVSTALRLFRIGSVFMFFRALFPMIWGIAALAVLGVIDHAQTALPLMVLEVVPRGLLGLVVVAFLAASMSTYDSYLLSFGSILVQDVGAVWIRSPLSDARRMFWTRVGILVIALFIYFWGVYYSFTSTVFRYITLTGSLSYAGIITGLVLGMYWRRMSTAGAYAAFLCSAIPPIVALIHPEITPTSAGLLSFLLAPAGALVGTLLTRDDRPSPAN